MNKDFKKLIDKDLLFNGKEFIELGTLEDEIISYNSKLHDILKNNEINFHNEAGFMLKIKKQVSNLELLPVVICFLCDKKYIDKLKDENLSPIEKGDIAAYVLLKTNIEKFLEEIEFMQKNEMLKDSYKWKDTKVFCKLKALVAEMYEKCNCIYISREEEQHKILCSNGEKYIRNFIYDNLKFKTIDNRIYMKKLEAGTEDASKYLINITKKILKFKKEEFIKEVEHVSEFYNILEKIINEEMNKEFETIISEFIYNTIFINK